MALTLTYGTPTLLNSGAASTTVVAPTCSIGDLLLIIVGYGGGSPVLGASGITGGGTGSWAELTGFPAGGNATATGITAAKKTAVSGDSAATFTVNLSQTAQKAIVWVVRVSDPNGTPTVGASNGIGGVAAATALTTPSITVAAGSTVLAAFTARGGTAATYTPAAWSGTSGSGVTGTERSDQTNTGSSQVSAELQDSNGTMIAGTVTAAATLSASLSYSAGIIELVPAAAAQAAARPLRPMLAAVARAAGW